MEKITEPTEPRLNFFFVTGREFDKLRTSLKASQFSLESIQLRNESLEEQLSDKSRLLDLSLSKEKLSIETVNQYQVIISQLREDKWQLAEEASTNMSIYQQEVERDRRDLQQRISKRNKSLQNRVDILEQDAAVSYQDKNEDDRDAD
jgi:hypothetical protein